MANLVLSAVAVGLRTAQVVSPDLAGRWAERLFFTPPHRPLTAAEEALLGRARAFRVEVEGRPVCAWQWGSGPVVLLVHGWGGAGGRFSAFVEPIVAAGFSAVTYDGPGHGLTGKGRSSAPELARALAAVVRAVGSPYGVVAHSLGGAVTGLALADGLAPRRVVLLCPVADPAAFVDRFAEQLKLSPRTMAALRARSERRIRFDWNHLPVVPIAARATMPALVVHDRGDETVSVQEGQAIAAAWPGAELVLTDGLGHRGVLRAPAIVQRAVSFVTTR